MGLRGLPDELHDATAAEAHTDDSVPVSVEKVDVRGYAFAGGVEVDDGLPGLGGVWGEEEGVYLCW